MTRLENELTSSQDIVNGFATHFESVFSKRTDNDSDVCDSDCDVM